MAAGIYIHIPFCRKKCGYCSFVSCCGDDGLFSRYTAAITDDIRSSKYAKAVIDTVFFGGGTPSVLPVRYLEKIFRAAYDTFRTGSNTEITFECNPESVTQELLAAIRGFGVNRLSMGVQSLDDGELKAAGRLHTAEEAMTALLAAKKYFDNISCDLMLGLPGQTEASLDMTLSKLTESKILTHISVYSLSVEEGTPLHTSNYSIDGDILRSRYDTASAFLKEAGFCRYEVSNFALPGYECRHNLKYWTGQDYYGFGAAAHSRAGNIRYNAGNDIGQYTSGVYVQESAPLSREDMIEEEIFLRLRLSQGISLSELKSKYGYDLMKDKGSKVSAHIKSGALILDKDRLSVADDYLYVMDSIIADLI